MLDIPTITLAKPQADSEGLLLLEKTASLTCRASPWQMLLPLARMPHLPSQGSPWQTLRGQQLLGTAAAALPRHLLEQLLLAKTAAAPLKPLQEQLLLATAAAASPGHRQRQTPTPQSRRTPLEMRRRCLPIGLPRLICSSVCEARSWLSRQSRQRQNPAVLQQRALADLVALARWLLPGPYPHPAGTAASTALCKTALQALLLSPIWQQTVTLGALPSAAMQLLQMAAPMPLLMVAGTATHLPWGTTAVCMGCQAATTPALQQAGIMMCL